ncbi:MAG: four helix bundle protein [Candidatus Cloacimonetes bacterium]|nr:four helix bundle protein [Candidatus Cloacimonadota bacterium]
MKKYEKDLYERLIQFAINTFKFLKSLPKDKEYDVFRYQLSKAATSIGANYSESQVGTTKEFYSRINICLREAREANFWYIIIDRLEIGDCKLCKELLRESDEIKRMFGSIAIKKIEKL